MKPFLPGPEQNYRRKFAHITQSMHDKKDITSSSPTERCTSNPATANPLDEAGLYHFVRQLILHTSLAGPSQRMVTSTPDPKAASSTNTRNLQDVALGPSNHPYGGIARWLRSPNSLAYLPQEELPLFGDRLQFERRCLLQMLRYGTGRMAHKSCPTLYGTVA